MSDDNFFSKWGSLRENITSSGLILFFLGLTFFLLPTRTAPPLIAIALAIFIWIMSGKFLAAGTIIRQRWFYPVIMFCLLPWIGLIYTKDWQLGVDYALKTKYWVAVFITAYVCLSEKNVNLLLKYFWSGLLLTTLVTIARMIGIVSHIDPRCSGLGMVYTLLSMYLIVGILTASFMVRKADNPRQKWMYFIIVALFFFHLAVLNARNGYFVFILVSPLVANNLMCRFSAWLKAAAILILIAALALSPNVRERVKKTIVNLNKKQVLLNGEWNQEFQRPFIMGSALKLMIEHPGIGIGTGSLIYYTREMGKPVAHPHNSILYMGVSFGILGVLSYFWLFGKMFILAWKNRSTLLGNLVLSICLVIFWGGIFETPIINNGTALLLPLGYGMLNHIKPAN